MIKNLKLGVLVLESIKIKIMSVYKSEMGKHPFPRSEKNIRALATYRLAIAGVDSAEAFQVLKIIKK